MWAGAAHKQKYLNANQPRDDLEKHPARESRQRHGKGPADPPSVLLGILAGRLNGDK